MTVKEFADKYNVPYHIAYKASLAIRPPASFRNNRDYDEGQLRDETLRHIISRIHELKIQHEQYVEAYKALKRT